MDVLKHIDELRIEKGWSIYKLAEMSDVTCSTLTNMFSRRTLPSLTTLMALCEAFNISLAEFFKTAENIEPNTEELQLIEKYRHLSQDRKKLVKDIIKEFNPD